MHSAIQELCLDTVLTSEEGVVSAQLRTCVAQSADLGRVEWGLQSVGMGLAGVPFRPQTWGAPLGVSLALSPSPWNSSLFEEGL